MVGLAVIEYDHTFLSLAISRRRNPYQSLAIRDMIPFGLA